MVLSSKKKAYKKWEFSWFYPLDWKRVVLEICIERENCTIDFWKSWDYGKKWLFGSFCRKRGNNRGYLWVFIIELVEGQKGNIGSLMMDLREEKGREKENGRRGEEKKELGWKLKLEFFEEKKMDGEVILRYWIICGFVHRLRIVW